MTPAFLVAEVLNNVIEVKEEMKLKLNFLHLQYSLKAIINGFYSFSKIIYIFRISKQNLLKLCSEMHLNTLKSNKTNFQLSTFNVIVYLIYISNKSK